MISKATFIKSLNPQKIRRRQQVVKFIKQYKKRGLKISKNEQGKVLNFTYLTITNRASFSMIETSLSTYFKRCTIFPSEIVIVSDGSWSLDVGVEYFSKYNLNFKFEDWSDCAEYHKRQGRDTLVQWAEKHIWGKKMCAIMKYSEKQATLFADPDVLWYNTPLSIEDIERDFILKSSIDNSHNYDQDLIQELNLHDLYRVPPINCGVVLAKGNLLEQSSNIIEKSLFKQANNPGKFAEQTIIAIMVHEFGETWSEKEITASIDDIISPIFDISNYSTTLIARHYVWAMTWMYWRDAFFVKVKQNIIL